MRSYERLSQPEIETLSINKLGKYTTWYTTPFLWIYEYILANAAFHVLTCSFNLRFWCGWENKQTIKLELFCEGVKRLENQGLYKRVIRRVVRESPQKFNFCSIMLIYRVWKCVSVRFKCACTHKQNIFFFNLQCEIYITNLILHIWHWTRIIFLICGKISAIYCGISSANPPLFLICILFTSIRMYNNATCYCQFIIFYFFCSSRTILPLLWCIMSRATLHKVHMRVYAFRQTAKEDYYKWKKKKTREARKKYSH